MGIQVAGNVETGGNLRLGDLGIGFGIGNDRLIG
jgi:hypothetical protein